MVVRTVGVALCGAAFASVAAAADMREMNWRLPLMAKAPTVDGIVDYAEWAGAHGSFGFVRYPTDTLGPVKSAFFVGRTKDRLYIAGLGEVGPAGLARAVKPRRGNVECTGDDCYEIVLVPDSTLPMPDIRHIIVNFNGAYRTQALVGGNMVAFSPSTQETKSSIRDGWWHFEWSIALSEIGFDTTPADRHAIRLCRNFKKIESQWGYQSSMRPNECGFFAAAKAVPTVFDDAAVSARLLVGDESDKSRWNLRLLLHNPTAREASVEAMVEGRPVNSQPGVLLKTVALKPGETVELPVTGPVLGDEKIKFVAEVKQGGKNVFFREFCWCPNGPAPQWLKDGDDGSAAKFDFAYFPSHGKMRLLADLSTVEKRPKSVTVSLLSNLPSATAPLAETEVALDADGVGDVLWDVPDLKAETQRTGVGGYVLKMTAKGVKGGEVSKAFRRDVFAWEGFAGGTSDAVPSMFTPIEETRTGLFGLWGDKVVKTVLREHTVDGKTGLWKQVVAAGKPVLARPMKLAAADGDAGYSVETSWDVDGMMRWNLTLRPGRHGPMSIEVPVLAERGRLLHPCADGMRFNYAGSVPSGTGRVWDSTKAPRTSIIGDYLPYIWVGGPLRGIAVFGENDRGWVLDDDESGNVPCQEVVREGDGTVVLRLNIVQKAVDLAEPRTIKMAFQATPVKPMAKDWRSIPIGGLIGSCLYWGGLTASDDIHPYDGTDEYWRKMAEARRTGKIDKTYVERAIAECMAHVPRDSAQYERRLKSRTAHVNSGMHSMAQRCRSDEKAVWYTNGRGVRLGNPEGTTFADEWTVEEFSKRPFAWDAAKSYSLDPCRSYLDFAAWWWEKALLLGVVDYYYWDDIFCKSNFDLVGTEAYRLPSGEIQPASGIFNQREQVRRCAVLQAEHGLCDSRNWVHMTNTALAPVLAFAGTNYDWEDVAGDTTIQQRYPKDSIQAQSIGRQFGNQVAVMGYFATKDPKSEKLKWLHRTGTGAVITHEIWWPRVKEWREANKLMEDWGYRRADTTVWNYWDEDVAFPVAVEGGESAALAMAKPGGEALVVVSDFKDGGDYSIRPDLSALGLSAGFTARNLETGAALPVIDGAVKVKLSPYDYVMVAFGPK